MTFPQAPIDADVELQLAGTWTDVSAYTLQRAGTSPPITITRGRPDETAKTTASVCQLQLNNRDGRFSPRNPAGAYYGSLAVRNNPLRVSVPGSGTYLRFADDNQSYVSCPDSASLQLTTNLSAQADMWLDDYQPCTLAGKWGAAAAAQAWCLVLNGDGTVTLYWNDGTHVNSAQSTQPLPYLGRIMVRAFLDITATQVLFYTAPTMSGSQTQLGAAVATGSAGNPQAAAGQIVQAGYVTGFAGQKIVSGGCLGKVLEFALFNASSVLVADPQFFAQTAGAASFADAQSNTWTLSGTAALSNRSYRFHGECAGLPQRWDTTGTDVWVPVAAAGVLRRKQQGSAPVRSPMFRGTTMFPSGPSAGCTSLTTPQSTIAYWPAEDPQGSTQIAAGIGVNSDGHVVTPMGIAGGPAFQGTAGSQSPDSQFPGSAQLVQVQQSSWVGQIPPYSSNASAVSLFFLLYVPAGAVASGTVLLTIYFAAGGWFDLIYSTSSGGQLSLGGSASTGGVTGINGEPVWVQIQQVGTGTRQSTLIINPVSVAFAQSVAGSSTVTGNAQAVVVNRGSANLGATEIGHLWVSGTFSNAVLATGTQPLWGVFPSPLNAWAGEPAGTRAGRLITEEGFRARVYGFPAATGVMGVQAIDTLINLLQACEDVDRGMLFDPAEALGIGYRTLSALQNQAVAATLSYTAATLGGDGAAGLNPTDDDQFTLNDVTVSRNGGSSARAQVTTGDMSVSNPPAGAGDYTTSLTVYCQADTQLPHIAGWVTHVGTADQERYPVIPLNLARAALTSSFFTLQNVRLGDRIQITSPPAWLPPGPIDQLVFGVSEKLGGFFWLMSWNAIPAAPYTVAVAGTGASDSAHADTDGSQLQTSISNSATSFSGATTGPSGTLWTTSAGDFPFQILMGGEVMTVTNITGAASPQTFTVTRSVNGVVKAQTAGTPFSVYPAPVAALTGA